MDLRTYYCHTYLDTEQRITLVFKFFIFNFARIDIDANVYGIINEVFYIYIYIYVTLLPSSNIIVPQKLVCVWFSFPCTLHVERLIYVSPCLWERLTYCYWTFRTFPGDQTPWKSSQYCASLKAMKHSNNPSKLKLVY